MGAVQADSEVGGVTWIELFVLFDTSGSRSAAGDHVKDLEAKARVEKKRRNEHAVERKGVRRRGCTML